MLPHLPGFDKILVGVERQSMLIEQAFHSLPEILVGAGYAKQDYSRGFEASIVGAFSLALLQELNGRNVQNPIACLMAEKRYLEEMDLRADLNVNLQPLRSGSEKFADFGFRFNNWIEAKYFRKTNGTTPSTKNVGLIVFDLIRLLVLPPHRKDNPKDLSNVGRYFLHVYHGDPISDSFLSRKRNDKQATGRSDRVWVTKLVAHGPQTLDDFNLDKEKVSFWSETDRKLNDAKLKLEIMNYKLTPSTKIQSENYTLILTRIDSGEFEWSGSKVKFEPDRTVVLPGDFNDFQNKICEALKSKKTTSKHR
jgi:hypothetical protein